MKITIENYGKQYSTLVDNDDLIIDEYIDIIYGLLISNGFHNDTILKAFNEFYEERKDE